MNIREKILVIEDEKSIARFISTVLSGNGYEAMQARTGAEALSMISSHCPDLVILDLGLPDMDGEVFIRTAREAGSTVPILVLSARLDERDKVSALDLGANDYIVKPFGTAELLARVRAALRTARRQNASGSTGNVFVQGDLVIDYDRRQVRVDGVCIHTTQTEYNILALLSQHVGKVMTYSAIIQAVWGTMDDGSTKKLQVNMANIRRKLGCRPGDNRFFVNELGVGYRMLDAEK